MGRTATELLTETNNNWDIELRDIFLNDSGTPLHVPGRRAITRINEDGSVIPLGISSARYVPISPKQAFSVIDPLVNLYGIDFQDLTVVDSGKSVFVTAKLEMEYDIVKGDTIIPKLIFRMRNDAFGGLKMIVCLHRMVCSNGLIIPIANQTITIPHLDDNGINNEKIQKWYDNISVFSNVLGGIKNACGHLAETPMTDVIPFALMAFQFDEPYEELGIRKRNIIDKVVDRFNTETPERTAWAAYNAVTANIDHDRNSRAHPDRLYQRKVDGGFAAVKKDAMNIVLSERYTAMGEFVAPREECLRIGRNRLTEFIRESKQSVN